MHGEHYRIIFIKVQKALTASCFSSQARMGLQQLFQGFLLIREGFLTGFWGLQCPIHCSGSPGFSFSWLDSSWVFSPASSFACGFSSLCHRTNRHQLPGHQPNLRSSGPDNSLQGIGPCMSDNPLDQVSDLVRALTRLSLALENNPQQRAPAAASAAPAGSSTAREDSFELITEEPSPSQVQGIRTQPVQIAYND